MTSLCILLGFGFVRGVVWNSWRLKNRATGALCYFYCTVCIIFFGAIAYFFLNFAYLAILDGISFWMYTIPAIPFLALVYESVQVAVHEVLDAPTHIVYKNTL